MLISEVGALWLVQSLLSYDAPGGEIVSCEFNDQKHCMQILERWGYGEPQQVHDIPGRRLAAALEGWVNEVTKQRRRMAADARSLSVQHLPTILHTLGCKVRDCESELDHCVGELHALGLSSEEIFPSNATKDPVERTFYEVYLKDLTGMLPKLSQCEPWSITVQEIIPHTRNGAVVEVELRTDIHPLHTETRIAPDAFCNRLFAHLCEVIAYYRVRADEAQQVLDTTLPQLIEKMKSRGVW